VTSPRTRLAILVLVGAACRCACAQDPLPSWNDGPHKSAIVDFVAKVTTEGGSDFVPPAERIAVFDNDGTLWCEQPMYVQFAFVLDRVKQLAPANPDFATTEPFQGILTGSLKQLFSGGAKAMVDLVTVTHANTTVDQFEKIVRDWLATARHPRFNRPYTELIYQPMLEVLAYLRANGFKTYIVSGGGVEFMRPWTEQAYGIPPEQVIGSSIAMQYEMRDGKPELRRLPKVHFINDKAGKPVSIQNAIGRRPIFAFGNSDGDFEMLQWTTTPQGPDDGPRLGLLVHHTDAEREYAYDRDSHFGRLSRGLDEGPKLGWVIVDMKADWKAVFPPPQRTR
jgi:phosphoserine phosphatase